MNVSSDKVVKHIALGHSKLDEMLQDEELVQRKRALQSSKPKRENIGPICPICDVRDPPREHVARYVLFFGLIFANLSACPFV